jgi:3-oxoacyl-(acyl-carrier-protein) synthase
MTPERVVVTGVGVIAPNGTGKEAFTKALRECKSGIRFLPELRDGGLACQVAGVPQGVEELSERYLTEEERFLSNHFVTYACVSAIDAWLDAGLRRPAPDSTEVDWDTGALVGTGCGAVEIMGERLVPIVNSRNIRKLGSTMEHTFGSANSARVAGIFALGNRVSTNSSACSTGNEAVIESFFRIRDGRAKRMLAGGSEGHCKYTWAGADAMRVLCRTHNDAPERASRPMSATAAGFVPSGGAGILVLESLSLARARGARIYAEVLGAHVNCGGQRTGGTMSAPNSEGVRRCIRAALAMADVRGDQVDAINGHLTATMADPLEIESWRAALDLTPATMPFIQATKSLVGHALGAAGGIECVAAVLQLDQGFLHGSLNCEDLHPALAAYADRIPRETMILPNLKVMAKASFGFGDVNACIIFRKFEN